MTASERAMFADVYHLYEKYNDPPAESPITDESEKFWINLSKDITKILDKEGNRMNLFLNSMLLAVYREAERKSAEKASNA